MSPRVTGVGDHAYLYHTMIIQRQICLQYLHLQREGIYIVSIIILIQILATFTALNLSEREGRT